MINNNSNHSINSINNLLNKKKEKSIYIFINFFLIIENRMKLKKSIQNLSNQLNSNNYRILNKQFSKRVQFYIKFVINYLS